MSTVNINGEAIPGELKFDRNRLVFRGVHKDIDFNPKRSEELVVEFKGKKFLCKTKKSYVKAAYGKDKLRIVIFDVEEELKDKPKNKKIEKVELKETEKAVDPLVLEEPKKAKPKKKSKKKKINKD
jgi:hypothetical protein